MVFEDFKSCHVDEAVTLIKMGFESQRGEMDFLPEFGDVFDKRGELEFFAEKNLGVAAVEDGKLLGFLCAYPAFSGAFSSPELSSCWSPVHGHGLSSSAGKLVWPLLVQNAMDKWRKMGGNMFSVTLFSAERNLADVMWNYGFGKRCEDAARKIVGTGSSIIPGFSIRQLDAGHFPELKELRRSLAEHLSLSPCMIAMAEDAFENHVKAKESNQNLTTLGLFDGNEALCGFIDLEDEGENFICCGTSFMNISGMFVKSGFRGKNLAACLVDAAQDFAADQNRSVLGVDYETMNPTAKGFWGKFFRPYTVSLVRRLDRSGL